MAIKWKKILRPLSYLAAAAAVIYTGGVILGALGIGSGTAGAIASGLGLDVGLAATLADAAILAGETKIATNIVNKAFGDNSDISTPAQLTPIIGPGADVPAQLNLVQDAINSGMTLSEVNYPASGSNLNTILVIGGAVLLILIIVLLFLVL